MYTNNKENQTENLLKRKEKNKIKKMWVASRPSNQAKKA